MRVTTVASASAMNPSSTCEPLRSGRPRTIVLSFTATDLPASRPLPEPVIGPIQAQAPCGFSAVFGARPGERGEVSAPGTTGSGIASSRWKAATDLFSVSRRIAALSALNVCRPRRAAAACKSVTVGPANPIAQAACCAEATAPQASIT
jgi:hypothetical protein